MKITQERISHPVGRPYEVIKTVNMAMEPLVDPEEMQDVGWHRVQGGVSLPLPESRVEVVPST